MPETGPINWMQEFADLVLIGLDSNVAGKPHGHLSEDTLAYLQQTLDTAHGRSVIVGIHHPPFLTGKAKMDIQNLRDSAALREILSAYIGEASCD